MARNTPRRLFAEQLEKLLKELGYCRHLDDIDDPEGIDFSAPLYPGYERFISINFDGPESHRVLNGFDVDLQIRSSRQASVREELEVLNCFRSPEFDEPIPESKVTILGVSMVWLVAKWGEPEEKEMAPLRWRRAWEYPYERLVDEVCSHVRTKGEKFFSYVNSPERLAEVLMDLEHFPGVTPGGAGPGSSSRWEFASVILRDLGRSDLALKAMNSGVELVRERARSGEIFPEALEFAECIFDCYRPWLSPH